MLILIFESLNVRVFESSDFRILESSNILKRCHSEARTARSIIPTSLEDATRMARKLSSMRMQAPKKPDHLWFVFVDMQHLCSPRAVALPQRVEQGTAVKKVDCVYGAKELRRAMRNKLRCNLLFCIDSRQRNERESRV